MKPIRRLLQAARKQWQKSTSGTKTGGMQVVLFAPFHITEEDEIVIGGSLPPTPAQMVLPGMEGHFRSETVGEYDGFIVFTMEATDDE